MIDVRTAQKICMENKGKQISKNVYLFGDTAHYVFIDETGVVAFEDYDTNTLYVFFDDETTRKYLEDYGWTFDTIVIFPRDIQVKIQNANYLESELSQEDADVLCQHLDWILGGEP